MGNTKGGSNENFRLPSGVAGDCLDGPGGDMTQRYKAQPCHPFPGSRTSPVLESEDHLPGDQQPSPLLFGVCDANVIDYVLYLIFQRARSLLPVARGRFRPVFAERKPSIWCAFLRLTVAKRLCSLIVALRIRLLLRAYGWRLKVNTFLLLCIPEIATFANIFKSRPWRLSDSCQQSSGARTLIWLVSGRQLKSIGPRTLSPGI